MPHEQSFLSSVLSVWEDQLTVMRLFLSLVHPLLPASGDEEETQPSTILSLDAMPEDDVKSSAWLADPNDGIKDAELRMLEAEFMETLTSVQLNIYKACITSGQTPTDYARTHNMRRQSVNDAITLIRKKAKKFF